MKKPIFALALVCASVSSAYAESPCDVIPTEGFAPAVTLAEKPVEIDRSLSITALNRKFKHTWSTAGAVTAEEFAVTASYKTTAWKMRAGGVCAMVSGQITMPKTPVKTYIAEDFRVGGCADKVVVAHEGEHAALMLKRHELIAAKVKEVVAAKYSHPTFFADTDSVNAGLHDIAKQLNKDIETATAEADKEVVDEIDTQAEYTRLKNICFDEFTAVYSHDNNH